MSLATSAAAAARDAQRRTPLEPTRLARVAYWGFALLWFAILTALIVIRGPAVAGHPATLGVWIATVLFLNLLPLTGVYGTAFSSDTPVLVAGTLILDPLEIAFVATLGSIDINELRGTTALSRALFNRSQIGLACLLSSLAGQSVLGIGPSPYLLIPAAILALAVMQATNATLVAGGVSLERQMGYLDALGTLTLGSRLDYGLALLSSAILGAMLTALYIEATVWAIVVFVIPALVVRQALARSQSLLDTVQDLQAREAALVELTHRIYEERSDERRMIAADLHDDVLQPLFKVTLMANVIKADLARGRLLDLEGDAEEVIEAADVTTRSLRNLIGNLRESAVGRGSLAQALQNLVARAQRETSIEVRARIPDIEADPIQQLTIYQIAKEAVGNALAHSKAQSLDIELRAEAVAIVLIVLDDGVGFDPVVQKKDHYGMQIMRERAAAVGGQLFVDAAPGQGCKVTFLLPLGGPQR
jgi:signal transduction histidine kinase